MKAVGALPAVASQVHKQSAVSSGLWSPTYRTWQGALVGFASRGRAQSFPLLSLATDSRARAWEGLDDTGRCQWGAGRGGGHRSLVFFFSQTLYLEKAKEMTQEL